MKINKIKHVSNNNRLVEMGLIRGTIFRVVKKVAGMLQLRTSNSNDIVIREETMEQYIEPTIGIW